MQPTENFSVPRRTLDVEDYIDILRRHKGWIFGPFLLTLVASVVGVYLWQDSYTSIAVIKVVPQQVPQNLVQSSVNQDLADRINSMATTILSRNVLTLIVNDNNLYARDRKHLPMEDVVENIMKKDLIVTPVMVGSNGRSVPAFTVQFSYPNRQLANKVNQKVVSLFISGDTTTRSSATSETSQFLKDQREEAKKTLESVEEKLQQFKSQNNGRLPDQMDANIRNLTTLQQNYQFLTSSKSRAESDKMTMETSLRVEKTRLAELTKETPAPVLVAAKSDRLMESERDIEALGVQLNLFLQRLTEDHPDVKNLRNRLEVAKNRKEQILKEEMEAKKPGAPAPSVNPLLRMQAVDVEGNIQRFESAIQAKAVDIADLQSQITQVQAQIGRVESQINSAPLGEQQYGDLVRERELAKTKYIELDQALSKAQLSQELEGRGQGERLEILDAASLPQEPTEPKRPLVIGIGAGLGLLLGLVIAAAREAKDTSLKNLKDVRAYTQMAILGSVPLLENDFVVRRRNRIAWLGWTTACLMAAITMAGSVAYYYATKT